MAVRFPSLQAYQELREEGKLSERRYLAVKTIMEHPDSTAYEISMILGKSDPNYIRPSICWLNENQYIYESATRKDIYTGRLAFTWRVRSDSEQGELLFT